MKAEDSGGGGYMGGMEVERTKSGVSRLNH